LYITGEVSPTVDGLRITGGSAVDPGHASQGGGVFVVSATATLRNNWVFSNTASSSGGLYLWDSVATLDGNIITFNTANQGGGGLSLDYSTATLDGNIITFNTANYGGGLYLWQSPATLSSNIVSANSATDSGGGLVLHYSAATLSSNAVTSNTANQGGGGLYLYSSDATLINNVVTDNRASTAGSGLYIRGSSPLLLYTTIARNHGGDGSGAYVTDDLGLTYSTVALTNTILVSHTVGITVAAGNTAILEATLWGSGAWANGTDWGGGGTIITGTQANNHWGDPAFVNPDNGNYHIGPGSTAIDVGIATRIVTDIDHEPRFGIPDLGADEYWAPGALKRVYLPIVVWQYP
jgi:parallel beta-helix repeat protein